MGSAARATPEDRCNKDSPGPAAYLPSCGAIKPNISSAGFIKDVRMPIEYSGHSDVMHEYSSNLENSMNINSMIERKSRRNKVLGSIKRRPFKN